MSGLFWASFALLWLLVGIQGFAFLEILRQLAQLRQQVGPKVGALIVPGAVETGDPLPSLSGLRADTLTPAAWHEYLEERVGVLVILRSGCTSCLALAGELNGLAAEMRGEASLLALVEGAVDAAQAFISGTGLDPSLTVIDEGAVTAGRLGILFNPGAVTVRDGKLEHGAIVNNAEQIHALVHANDPGTRPPRELHGSQAFYEAMVGEEVST